jgi:hypothetical protein
MQFQSFEPGIEVRGDCIGAFVDGFRQYPTVATKYLSKHNLLKRENGKAPALDRTAWYSLDDWLLAFKGITEEVGNNSVFNVGKWIPKNAVFPPHVKDVHSAIQSINVAYHMNHRKGGVVMFDPDNGNMLKGIGQYTYEQRAEREIALVCENPYPCELDRGIVTAMAARFETFAKTIHDENGKCRKKGDEVCTYVVTW